ncbi:MAG: hypothetical protein IKG93_09920 [Clostridiales bacterium]|nr:hypothetical protein [Clostridiales bacterium]
MSQIKALLDELQKREKDIFPQVFAKSGLLAKDVTAIGKELKLKFPASFKEFLRTYQIPAAKVYICFCGETFANSFGISYDRKKNTYVDSEEEEITVELDWISYDVSSVEAFITSFHEINDNTSAWAKAGFILIGDFRGYKVFLDTKEDVVYSIYHEDLYESEDYEDPKAARECMEENAHELCDNFEQFLKVICTGKPFDEDEHILSGEEPVEEQPVETSADLSACFLKVGEASDTPIKNQDKIGGYPTYLPDEIPEADSYGGHFMMELYNHGYADPDIICWQIYTGECATINPCIVEIRKGAKLYDVSSKLIRKRRWLHEFPLIFESADPKKLDGTVSAIGGKVPKLAKNAFKRKKITYLGVITEVITPNKELYLYAYSNEGIMAFGFDENGKFYAEIFA